MKAEILSRYAIENYKFDPEKKYAVVSITNSGKANFKESKNVKAIRENFYDSDSSDGISDYQATEIANFIKENFWSSDVFITHCEAGISRSSAVMAAALDWATKSSKEVFDNPKYMPNMRVYKKVLDKLRMNG